MKKEFTLSNGVVIPEVGFGSYLSTVNTGKDSIKTAFEAGYRYIDTARFYNNEEEVGEAWTEYGLKRDEIFLCSKVWPTFLGYDKTKESFEESCRCLKTDHLDMYLIHWPKQNQKDDKWAEKMADGWRALEDLYEEGRIKAIGVSNFLPHHLMRLMKTAKIKPMLDQLELHVGYMQEYTLKYLEGEGILPQAWSPLGRGRVLNDPRVEALASKYGRTNAQILLRFLIDRGIPVIPKASSLERMKENLDVDGFKLSDEEISYLSSIPETGWSGEHPDMVDF